MTLSGKFRYFSPEWDEVSSSAKDFISSLILVDTSKRMTADKALEHEWMKSTPKKVNLSKISENLVKNFNAKRKLKSSVEAVIAANGFLKIKSLGVLSGK